MDNKTAKCLFSIQDQNNHWTQSLKLANHDNTTNLAEAVGDKAITPHNSNYQPCNYPKGSVYCFDPEKFGGKEPNINKLVQEMCVGCTLYLQRNGTENTSNLSYQ